MSEEKQNQEELARKTALAALTEKQKQRAERVMNLLKQQTSSKDTLSAGWLFMGRVSLEKIETNFGTRIATILAQACGPLDSADPQAKNIRLAEFINSIGENNLFSLSSEARQKLRERYYGCSGKLYEKLLTVKV